MATVRYLVDDVDAALPFYAALGFSLADGRVPPPGGWNRLVVEVDDLDATLAALQAGAARLRSAPIEGPGGRQVLVDDPSGNPIELFEARAS